MTDIRAVAAAAIYPGLGMEPDAEGVAAVLELLGQLAAIAPDGPEMLKAKDALEERVESQRKEFGELLESEREREIKSGEIRVIETPHGTLLAREVGDLTPAPTTLRIKRTESLGFVGVDSAHVLIVDPAQVQDGGPDHGDLLSLGLFEPGCWAVSSGIGGVVCPSGFGDGRYEVLGDIVDTPFGEVLGQIRVAFVLPEESS